MDIKRWLNQLNLPQYEEIFQDYDHVQDLLHLEEGDIYKMGVKNSAHRANITSSLHQLRYKANTRGSRLNLTQPNQSTSSAAVDEHADSPTLRSNLWSPRAQTSVSLLNIAHMDFQSPQTKEREAQYIRSQLEWELSQDSRQLESHAWYHGPISRAHAESVLKNDGDFLIRDCSTGKPGDLVLSCFWRGGHLHFIINKVVIQPYTVYQSIQYRLECEPFHSIPDLVTCYVGSGKAVTAASGARIVTPVNRTLPLSVYSSRFAHRHPSTIGQYATLPSKSSAAAESCRSPLRIQADCASPTFSTHSLPRQTSVERRKLSRAPSESSINPPQTPETPSAPAKPSRVPSQIYPIEDSGEDMSSLVTVIDAQSASDDSTPSTPTEQSVQLPEHPQPTDGQPGTEQPASNEVSDEASADQNVSQFCTFPRRRNARKFLRPANLRKRHSLTESNDPESKVEITFNQPECQESSDPDVVDDDRTPTNPVSNHVFPAQSPPSSMFDVDSFQTVLLPSVENKPLDMEALEKLCNLFEENTFRTLALHLLHGDLDLLGGLMGIDNASPQYQKHYEQHVGLSSGIELCTLPHGQQLRADLLERTLCLKLLVAVTILTGSSPEDRAAMLNRWIQLAMECQMALGNMFSFTGLLLGLSMPQIQRLDSTWHLLRQQHTQTAYTFEARLKPTIKLIAAGTNPHATQPNCTVPDLHSAILLWEPTLESFLSDDGISIPGVDFRMDNCGPDFGLDVLSNHVSLVRSWSVNLPLYVRNARIALENVEFDEVLLDVFRTEFQMKFLWGSKGAAADSQTRHGKFEQVLYAFSERCEPS